MATDGRLIETPFGPRLEKVWGRMDILGISSFFTQTLNQGNDQLDREEFVNISVPPGTLAIVPMPNLWFLGHGSLSPERLDPTDDNETVTWHPNDRPWGLGWVQVSVIDVNEPDFSMTPPQQSAQLKVVLHLCDYNLDDSWFGSVGYTLIFLGRSRTTGLGASAGSSPVSPLGAGPTPEPASGSGASSARRVKWERRKMG